MSYWDLKGDNGFKITKKIHPQKHSDFIFLGPINNLSIFPRNVRNGLISKRKRYTIFKTTFITITTSYVLATR